MFIIEIEPYKERIRLFQKGEGIPNHEQLREIANIYDEWIRDKAFTKKTCIGCANEVKHMFNQLTGAIQREGNKPIALTPKIPKLEPIKKHKDDVLVEEISAVDMLKWGAFKTHCKKQGINVKGKTKVELLKELGIS